MSAHPVHLGPLLLQEVLLAVPLLGGRPPQLGHRPELVPVAVEAHELFSIIEVSVQQPHPLGPVEEMTLALMILQEMCCRDRIDLVTGVDSWGEANEGWRAGATPTNAGRQAQLGPLGLALTPSLAPPAPQLPAHLEFFHLPQQTEAAGGLGKSLLSKPF